MNLTEERLDFWTCFFLDSGSHIVFPQSDNFVFSGDENTNDSAENLEIDTNSVKALHAHNYYCKAHGAYLTGDDIGGQVVCILIHTLIVLIGLFGVVTNILNVILLQKSFPGKGPTSFKESLVFLSVVELVLCIAIIGFSFFAVLIMENFSRGYATIELFRTSNLIFTLTRTMSVYTSILITVERFLVVAFPTKSKAWLYDDPWKSRIALGIVVVYAFLLNLPWMLKSSIKANDYMTEIPTENIFNFNVSTDEDHAMSKELMDFPYLITRNKFAENFNRGLQETLLALDFVVPFPVLLIFNILLYRSIYKWNKAREALSGHHKSDINAAKMFSVVVFILLSCHSVSCAVFFTSRVRHTAYRELMLLQNLAVAFGASANFLVYYWFKSGFQREFWGVMRSVFGTNCSWINRHYEKFRKDSTIHSHGSVHS